MLGFNEISFSPQALHIYKQKDVVEKALKNYKDKCGGRKMRSQETSLDGRIFPTYLSLILQRRLEQAKKNPWDMSRIIDELSATM